MRLLVIKNYKQCDPNDMCYVTLFRPKISSADVIKLLQQEEKRLQNNYNKKYVSVVDKIYNLDK